MSEQVKKIFIDADACPVKEEVYRVAIREKIEVLVVCNGGIRPHQHPLIRLKIVSEGLDEADNWIVDQVGGKDLVITDDIPLAARCVNNGAIVIKSNGAKVDTDNIGYILANRNLMTEIRSSNPFFQGSGKVYSAQDRSKFLNALDKEIKRDR